MTVSFKICVVTQNRKDISGQEELGTLSRDYYLYE